MKNLIKLKIILPGLSPFMTYHRFFFNLSNTTGVTSGAGTAYPSGAPGFTAPAISGVCVFLRDL